jgi:hypothetical protein
MLRNSHETRNRIEQMRSAIVRQVPIILRAFKEDGRLAHFNHTLLGGKLGALSESMGLPETIRLSQLPNYMKNARDEHVIQAHKIVEGYLRGISTVRKLSK